MGLFRDWFDRLLGGPSEINELMNPLLGWRLLHSVRIPEDENHSLKH